MAGQIILVAVALSVIVLGGNQLIGPRLVKYRITNEAIELVLVGNMCIWRCSFDDISDVRLISFLEMMVTPYLHLMNRPFARYVFVRKRRGILRGVVITPDNAENFVTLVRQKTGISA